MTPTGTTFELVRERSIDLAALRHRCPSLVAGALISLVYLSPLAHLAPYDPDWYYVRAGT